MGVSIRDDFNFTLDSLFGANAQFQLKKASIWYEYDDDKKQTTDTQLGYKYQVIHRENVVKFDVKVDSKTPIISVSDLRRARNPIFVTFTNTSVSFYGKSLYDCDLSVFAEEITIVGTDDKVQTEKFKLNAKP